MKQTVYDRLLIHTNCPDLTTMVESLKPTMVPNIGRLAAYVLNEYGTPRSPEEKAVSFLVVMIDDLWNEFVSENITPINMEARISIEAVLDYDDDDEIIVTACPVAFVSQPDIIQRFPLETFEILHSIGGQVATVIGPSKSKPHVWGHEITPRDGSTCRTYFIEPDEGMIVGFLLNRKFYKDKEANKK